MKKNHERVEQLIRSAILACGDDAVFSETKSYLSSALRSTVKVSEKRSRNIATQKYIEKAKETQKEWWDMLKNNAAKNFNLEIPPETNII